MSPALVDTDLLSLFLRGDRQVVASFERYLAEHSRINLSIITYYEILSGLRHRDAKRQLGDFLDLASESNILHLTERSCDISASLYARLRKEGRPIDDIDILIAGVAIANGLTVATRNTRHFGAIAGLEVEDWAGAG